MQNTATPSAVRPPFRANSPWRWAKENLFNSWLNSIISLVIIALAVTWIPGMLHWFFGGAVFRVDLEACRALEHEAACWGVIHEKYRLILFGRFPYDEQWRPLIAMILMIGMLMASCLKQFWRWWILPMWLAVLVVFFTLMWGIPDSNVLPYVESENWGGLPLTILLATLGIGGSFPLAIMLALGRRSNYPIIKSFCVMYIEIIRGIPLVTVLFLAAFMFPLFMPPGFNISQLLRVGLGIFFFSAAYLAEVVRGGLQSLPTGQMEAAQSMGLSYWQTMRLIILPQALRVVVPPLVGSFIATFKDTSLVTIVGLFELLGSLKLAYGDAPWRPFYIEGYIFVSAIYFVFCYSMSKYSQYLERELNKGVHR